MRPGNEDCWSCPCPQNRRGPFVGEVERRRLRFGRELSGDEERRTDVRQRDAHRHDAGGGLSHVLAEAFHEPAKACRVAAGVRGGRWRRRRPAFRADARHLRPQRGTPRTGIGFGPEGTGLRFDLEARRVSARRRPVRDTGRSTAGSSTRASPLTFHAVARCRYTSSTANVGAFSPVRPFWSGSR